MSEALAVAAYVVIVAVWLVGRRDRHRWCVDGVLDALGADIRYIGAVFVAMAAEYERWINRVLHGQPSDRRLATRGGLDAIEADFLHDAIDIYEYERRVGRLLGVQETR